MEDKVKRHFEKFIDIEEMGEYILDVLVPTETVVEVKNGKKSVRVRKLYPGYVFVHMRLFDENGKIMPGPWEFVRKPHGVIGFANGDNPVALKQEDMDRILAQIAEMEGKEVPKVVYGVGEEVKISDGPFANLTGRIDEIDPERGRLKVSVSIFGRFTPVELEYWQVERVTD